MRPQNAFEQVMGSSIRKDKVVLNSGYIFLFVVVMSAGSVNFREFWRGGGGGWERERES